MKRVLHHYPYSTFDTGSPKALAGFIDVTDRARYDVMFMANKPGPLIDALVGRGIKIIDDPAGALELLHPMRSASLLAHKVRMLRKLAPDIVHVTGFGWNDDLVVAAGLLHIPVILHVHLPSEAAYQNLNRFWVDKVLFCSAFEAQNFKHARRIGGKAQVLYNVIHGDVFERAQADRARFGLTDQDVVVAIVSQLSNRKGIDIALDAARTVLATRNDVMFVHAGPDACDEPGFGASIRARVAADPLLRDRFRFLGSRKDVAELMASCDVFFMPSRAEPFGLVVCEAMSAAKPVVVSDVGGIPEAVGSVDHGRLVRGFEPGGFAAAILEVLSLPDRGRDMGRLARASVRARFHPDVIGTQLNAIYDSLLN